jgi:membrane protease YdiL (CAAX protease family)
MDVFRVVLIGAVILFATILATTIVVPGPTFKDRLLRLSASPILLILAQMFAYILLLGYMVLLVKRERRSPRFWKAIHWNWPTTIWPYLVIGFVMQIALLGLERFLPLPKQTPFDALLRNPVNVLLIAVFAITLGPLMEELFFRGFFYPILARRFGMIAGIAVSAFGFGLVHAAQYGYSWASVLLITLVGVVLGTVRAVKDSVAAGFLVHAAYNSTIILMIVIASDGLRHLEKLSTP